MSMWVYPSIAPEALRQAEEESLVGLERLETRGYADVFSKKNSSGISSLCSHPWLH